MRTYTYTGTISSISFRKSNSIHASSATIELHDMRNDEVAPTRLDVIGTLADYLNDLEWTDDEERYLTSVFYYDITLTLLAVEVHSSDPDIPAKVIAMNDPRGLMDIGTTFFGPKEHIDATEPEPMSEEAFREWRLYKSRCFRI